MSQEPALERLSLRESFCRVVRVRPSEEYADCLVIAFDGEVGNSREHCGTFTYMEAMIAAGIAAWDPSAVVLDLRKLTYEWGDGMARVLGTIPLPIAVVISDRNREGLTSLVEDELLEPSDWLFNSLSDALAACERKYVAVREERTSDADSLRGCDGCP